MWKNILFVFVLGGLLVGYVVAQPGEPVQDNPGAMASSREALTPEQMAQHWQQNTARCLLLGDQEQVLMGEFAAERAQSPEVKAYAQSMVKSHNECIAKLQKFAPDSMSTEELGKRAYACQLEMKSEKATTPVTSEMDEGTPKAMSKGGQHPMRMFAAMQQKMAENCLALTQSELSQVDKDRFDKAYIGQQIFSHIATLAKLKTMESFASAELKPIIESEEAAVRGHLDQAKNMCKQLDAKVVSSHPTTSAR